MRDVLSDLAEFGTSGRIVEARNNVLATVCHGSVKSQPTTDDLGNECIAK